MELTITKRKAGQKSINKAIRREGNIPAIVYSEGNPGEPTVVNGEEFAAVLRQMRPGHLPNTIFTLKDEDGKNFRAVVKDIEYHRTTYNIVHLDFEKLDDKTAVTVKIPIEFSGKADCVGVKLGGVVRQVIRHLPVRCLPKDIPDTFTIDVQDLNINQSRRMNAIAMPENVRPMADLNEVAVVIAKR